VDPIVAARKLLSDEVTAQHQRLVDDLASLLREYDDRGALKSTGPLMEGTLICCAMLQDRVEIFSKVLKSVVASSGAAQRNFNALELKGLVGEFLRPKDPFLLEQLSGLISVAEAPDVIDKLLDKVEKTRAHVLMRLGVEIDLLCRRTGSSGSSFWRSRHFHRGLIFAEIGLIVATVWYAFLMVYNPAANAEIPLILTGILTFFLNWMRRAVAANL
jgi:hypothetical protein